MSSLLFLESHVWKDAEVLLVIERMMPVIFLREYPHSKSEYSVGVDGLIDEFSRGWSVSMQLRSKRNSSADSYLLDVVHVVHVPIRQPVVWPKGS